MKVLSCLFSFILILEHVQCQEYLTEYDLNDNTNENTTSIQYELATVASLPAENDTLDYDGSGYEDEYSDLNETLEDEVISEETNNGTQSEEVPWLPLYLDYTEELRNALGNENESNVKLENVTELSSGQEVSTVHLDDIDSSGNIDDGSAIDLFEKVNEEGSGISSSGEEDLMEDLSEIESSVDEGSESAMLDYEDSDTDGNYTEYQELSKENATSSEEDLSVDEKTESSEEEESNEEEATEAEIEEKESDFFEPVIFRGACEEFPHGCCEDYVHPAHGPNGLGCCSYTEFGCCPDALTHADGPYGEGCDCISYEFGCCPDGLTPAQGAKNEGCGCQYSPHGCCPDQSSYADGPNFEGCSCDTYPFGCCPDGESVADGPNLEGCPPCNSEHGCCPDGVTPRSADNSSCEGCQASEHGCCLDGELKASGPYLEGCPMKPGEMCHFPSETGPCSNYTTMWFYDMEYGGCNRFWYGGCEPGKNHFETEEDCQESCISPKGSGVCFLPKVIGPCEGNYMEWFFDKNSKRCVQFSYGGCLGNENRFQTKEACENKCIPERPGLPICSLPKAEGACAGQFPRWFYNSETGDCEAFNYSGCLGNANQFMTEGECNAVCRHKAKKRQTDLVCQLPIAPGNCNGTDNANSTLPRWGHDPRRRSCIPFYYTGCEGNENNFKSRSDCESICPTTFPPSIVLPSGSEILAERKSRNLLLPVQIRANPLPDVTWSRLGRVITKYDTEYKIMADHSLRLQGVVTDLDAGVYTVTADNGIGDPASKELNVIVHPIFPSVRIGMDVSIFKPGSDVTIPCEVKTYPPLEVTWHFMGRGQSEKQPLTSDRTNFFIEPIQESTTVIKSHLTLMNVTDRNSGVYTCQVSSDIFGTLEDNHRIIIRYQPGEVCEDSPTFHHCKAVVKYRYCESRYYGLYCCKSCTEAGFVPGGMKI